MHKIGVCVYLDNNIYESIKLMYPKKISELVNNFLTSLVLKEDNYNDETITLKKLAKMIEDKKKVMKDMAIELSNLNTEMQTELNKSNIEKNQKQKEAEEMLTALKRAGDI